MTAHRWHFIRSGGVDQVVIRSGADIVNLESLDQTLWVAVACPTRGIDLDPRTLDLLDTDHDGRIRPPEILAATRWVRDRLRDPDVLVGSGSTVDVASIDTAKPQGEALAAAVRELLGLIGKSGAASIELGDFDALAEVLAQRPANGDGVIVARRMTEPMTRTLVEEIGAAYGWVEDRSGEHGVDRARVDRYLDDFARLQSWHAQATAEAALDPLGQCTAEAASTLAAVVAKIDDYFVRAELKAYDPAAAPSLDLPEALYRSLALDKLAPAHEELRRMPLAIPRADGVLAFTGAVNPAWAGELSAFRRDLAEPLLGRGLAELDAASWQDLRARLEPCSAWMERKPTTPLDGLALARIAALDLAAARAALYAAIDEDERAAAQNERFAQVERLVRYQRDLVRLLNNFVSFPEFYAGRRYSRPARSIWTLAAAI